MKILYLFQLEWLKVKRYTPFLVLLGMYVVLMPSFMLSTKMMNIPKELGGNDAILMFPNIWHTLAYLGNWLSFFVLGFLSVLTITNEFSNRTLRQNIINGLSRTDFFLAKLIYIIALSLFTTLVYVFFALIIGWFHTENIYFSRITEGGQWIGRYFLMCLSFSAIGLFLGMLLRKSGLSLFLYLTWTFFVEKIIRYGVHRSMIKNETMHYYPLNSTNDLVPPPVPKMLNQMMENSSFKMYLDPQTAVIVVSVYITLFLAITYFLVKNKDL